jgi:hypothetical protein
VAGDACDWEADKLRRSAMQLTSNHIGECEDKEKIHDDDSDYIRATEAVVVFETYARERSDGNFVSHSLTTRRLN